MLSGALPTCSNLALSTGSPAPSSESLNWDIISRRSTTSCHEQNVKRRTDVTQLIENTRTMPSIVTLITRSPSSCVAPRMICTPMLTVVCWPNRTIFVPARQSQQTRALSAPADTKFLDDSATARIPFKCPASCCSGVNVSEE